MSLDSTVSRRLWRPVLLMASIVAGLLTIVGSGGGSADGCLLAPGPCRGDFPDEPRTPTVSPGRATVQVGSPAVFTVDTPGIVPTGYVWERAPRAGAFTVVPGASGPTYTLPGVNLADDGAAFRVTVNGQFDGKLVLITSSTARLAVSSQPAVVLQDSDFAPADWAAAAHIEPAASGPTHIDEQITTGGNPGAYRRSTLAMTAGPSRMDLFNTYQAGSYDPTTQGAVYIVEFTLDCQALPGVLGVGPLLLLEQAGRRYIAGGPILCGKPGWSHDTLILGSFVSGNFFQVEGPACTTTGGCPDFSSSGAAMRFGYYNSNQGTLGFVGAAGGLAVDNWKVSVWRR